MLLTMKNVDFSQLRLLQKGELRISATETMEKQISCTEGWVYLRNEWTYYVL